MNQMSTWIRQFVAHDRPDVSTGVGFGRLGALTLGFKQDARR